MCPDTDKTLKKANGASRPGAFGVSERAASAHSSRPEASPWAQLPSGLTPAARFAPPTPLRVLRPSKVSELKHSSYNFVMQIHFVTLPLDGCWWRWGRGVDTSPG